jgi:hypothetical protein
VSTSFELADQIKENDKTAKLIELLETYENNCEIYFEQIKTYYDTIKIELNAYKDSITPPARVSHSSVVADRNVLLINLISENC